MFRDRPLFGCGFGQYLEESLPYFSARISDQPIEMAKTYVQHNVVLSLLTETGLAGASLYVAMLGTWLVTACKLVMRKGVSLAKRQQGLLFLSVLCSFCVSGTFQDVTIINMAHMLLFFLSGFVMSLNHITRPLSIRPRNGHGSRNTIETQATSTSFLPNPQS
jgi:O-antigen ligase